MSTKKDKFSPKDKIFMKLAINLARERVGLTGSNPSVGCVITKKDKLISIGQTSINGKPHAEYNAITDCKVNLKNSSIYISLEPCTHFGKTPPCTNQIIKSKIAKVYYAIDDVDNRTSKKAMPILKNKKIKVKKNLLLNDAKNLYKSYFYIKKNKYPYVTGKIACSKDMFISTKNKIITNFHSRKISHLLRYKNQGILISSKTLNLDNSKLTCRLSGLEKFSPKRFILDKDLKIKTNLKIFQNHITNTYIFFNKPNNKKEKILKKLGAKLIKSKLDLEKKIDLKFVLQKIKKLGINYLLVEGGRILTLSFLKKKLFNEFYLFKNNKNLGMKGSINISKILIKLKYIFKTKKKIITHLDKDVILNYY